METQKAKTILKNKMKHGGRMIPTLKRATYYKATEIKKWGLAQDQCTSMIRNADPRNIRNIYICILN